MSITLAEICDGIKDGFSSAANLRVSQSYDELTEGIHDFPLMQVYPSRGHADAANANDRTTFSGGIRQTEFVIVADIYVSPMADIAEDMADTVALIDQLWDLCEDQTSADFFDITGCRSWNWSFDYATLIYAGISYRGVRWTFTIRVM